MERLTEKSVGCFGYSLVDKSECKPGAFADYDVLFSHSMAVKKLGKYEDTGLTPQEVHELKEKQIPKKIKSSNIEGFSTLYGCPRCDKMCRNLWSFGIKTNHCPDCGQKLDWSDTE